MIGYYLHHHGQGHRRRATAVAGHLRHEVTGLGTGGPPQDWPGPWVELAPDDDPPVHDIAARDVTAGGVLHWVPRHHPGLRTRHRQVVDWLDRERPDLVVVDVSVEISLLVRLCGIPVVVGGMPGQRADDPAHALAYDLADAILAPWPEGAHEGWPQRWLDKTWHVGGISALVDAQRPTVQHVTSEHVTAQHAPSRQVLVLWGGGTQLQEALVDQARAATPGWSWTVRGPGPDASPDLLADLLSADVVVCHAGQGAVADVALTRRPAIVLAQARPFDEQDATVAALDRLGLAVTAAGWPAPDQWPALLQQATARGGRGWDAWGGAGGRTAAALLDGLAGRGDQVRAWSA